MSTCTIFGGAGFIGTHLAQRLLASRLFTGVHIADTRSSPLIGQHGVTTSITDVREQVPLSLCDSRPQWIFNLAAVHREPGHLHYEYFDANVAGARNVCAYAEAVECSNMFFTSSISVYGPTSGPTSEASRIAPTSAYGASKLAAELIHEGWQRASKGRRLIVCRPGVIYGPGDPGNILRMVSAIRRGYFALPGSPGLYKSYGYVFGLLDSVELLLARNEPVLYYNYVEHPTETLGTLVGEIKSFLNSRAPVVRLPRSVLVPAAVAAQALLGARNPIHPVRVRKAATSTHIVPQTLIDFGFPFQYPFVKSLEHWRRLAPEDFGDR